MVVFRVKRPLVFVSSWVSSVFTRVNLSNIPVFPKFPLLAGHSKQSSNAFKFRLRKFTNPVALPKVLRFCQP